MKLLAIDTTSAWGGAALLAGPEVLAEEIFPLRQSAATELLPAINRLFTKVGLARNELQAIAVATGPGSFTGIRIGVATAQGIAAADALPVYGVSSLTVLARQATIQSPSLLGGEGKKCIAVLRHARADEYYFCLYQDGHELIPPGREERSDIEERLCELEPPPLLIIEEGTLPETPFLPERIVVHSVRGRPATVGWVARELPLKAAFRGGIGLKPHF